MLAEDSNHDGKLSQADAAWNQLRVWVDADSDGSTDAGELLTLDQLGIVDLDLNAQRGTEMDNGNLLGLVSSYTTQDGQTHDMADVWFAKAQQSEPTVEAAAGIVEDGALASTQVVAAAVTVDALSQAEGRSDVDLSDLLSGPTDDILDGTTLSTTPIDSPSATTTTTSLPADNETPLILDRTRLIDDKNNDLLI
jgi:hypothetical protein